MVKVETPGPETVTPMAATAVLVGREDTAATVGRARAAVVSVEMAALAAMGATRGPTTRAGMADQGGTAEMQAMAGADRVEEAMAATPVTGEHRTVMEDTVATEERVRREERTATTVHPEPSCACT